MERTKTPEQRIDFIGGQATALCIAVHVLMRTSEQSEAIAQALHAELEQMFVKLSERMPDETLRGFEFVRDHFLLKQPEDPGQPRVR